MKNFTVKVGKFLVDHMWLQVLLNFTWGLLHTIVGFIVYLVLLLIPKKQLGKFNDYRYIMFGNNWGGLSLVYFFLVADNMGDSWTHHTKQHEVGHSFQNAMFGPFMLLINIASIVRWWVFRFRKVNPDYDSIWFEGSATEIGEYYDNKKGGRL